MSKKKKNKKIPTSALFRVSKLLGTTGIILGRELSNQVAKKAGFEKLKDKVQQRTEYALEIVQTLGQLKGAALKAGQMLSLEFSDLLPKEVNKILSSMNDKSTFMDIEDVLKILKKELGSEQLAKLENITDEPIAAASIGQVHSATFNGSRVAIKVQYPKVDRTIDTDLNTLKRLIKTFIKVTKRNINIDGTFAEIRKNLRREVDYNQEAAQLAKYKDFFESNNNYIVPTVLSDFSTKRVLTMSLEQGDKIRDYLLSPELDSNLIAKLVLDLLKLEFFTFGLVQTDPNPGNFLIQPTEGRLVLLDLGSNKQYSVAFRKKIIRLLRVSMNGTNQELIEYAHKLKILDPKESLEVKMLFTELMQQIISMYRPENQPFDFGSEAYLKGIRQKSVEFVKLVQHTNPEKELIFLNRKLGGMFHILKDAESVVNLKPYWDGVLSLEKTL